MSSRALAPVFDWLRVHDRDYVALRRAGRAAIVMPSVFAISLKVIDNPTVALFTAFGAIAQLVLVGFAGATRNRLEAQAALAIAGAVLISLATLASHQVWLAAVSMALVTFVVIFLGIVSSVIAVASTALLLAFILPVATPAPLSELPDRLYGWGLHRGPPSSPCGFFGRRRCARHYARASRRRVGPSPCGLPHWVTTPRERLTTPCVRVIPWRRFNRCFWPRRGVRVV